MTFIGIRWFFCLYVQNLNVNDIYQRDILGEIYGIIDKNGKRFVTYKYTAYGVPTIEIPGNLTTTELSLAQAIRDLNIYLYKGYVYDQETGLYYCHSRYYNPKIGRWISIDDVSYLDPKSINGMNLYAYCGNNPVMFSDPSGRLFLSVLIGSIIIGGLISGGFAAKKAVENDLGFWGVAGSFAAGFIIGGAIGTATALGGAAGLASTGAIISGFSLSTGTALALSIGVTASAGFMSYTLEQASYGREFKLGDASLFALKSGLQGALAFGAGYIGGRSHLFDQMLGKDMASIHRSLTMEMTKNPSLYRQGVFYAQTLMGPSFAKAVYVSGVTFASRKIIDWIFGY